MRRVEGAENAIIVEYAHACATALLPIARALPSALGVAVRVIRV